MEQAREKTAWRMVGKRYIGDYPSGSHIGDGKRTDRSRLPRAILDQHWRRREAKVFAVQMGKRRYRGWRWFATWDWKLVSRGIISVCAWVLFVDVKANLRLCFQRLGSGPFFYLTSALSSVGQAPRFGGACPRQQWRPICICLNIEKLYTKLLHN